MTVPAGWVRHAVVREDRPDGSILLRSAHRLEPVAPKTTDWLRHWAEETPGAVFLAERSGAGWRELTYRAALERVRSLAAALVARGLGPDTPILILSGNGIDHGLLALAGQYVGVPVVPVAEQYALIPGAHERLRHVIGLVRPRLAYAADAERFADALSLEALDGVEIVASRPGGRGATPFGELLKGDAGIDVETAAAAVGPDSVAKILMTSGSTASPKGVITTHRMMCTNQAQIASVLPLLKARPPRILDWLPWNHVFGGSHNFNMMLANGGALYIDDGRPVKGRFERTLENLALVTGTLSFNVPVGYALLLGALRADGSLRRRFFADLDLVFYAGASLPQEVWRGLEAMATEIRGRSCLMTSSWGLTETAPACVLQHEPAAGSGIVGVPLPGVTAKLIPDRDLRCEVRVKGDNVTPGYLDAPEQTAAAFDGEGYLITGDAMAFVDPRDPDKGLRFVGRMSEDFKLLTGTWVRAAALRLDLLACLTPLAADVVVVGADRAEVGALIVPDREALGAQGFAVAEAAGALRCAALQAEIARRLAGQAARASGSSTRVVRALVLAEPPSMAEGEMTAKGNLNFARLLARRAALVERLYDDGEPALARI